MDDPHDPNDPDDAIPLDAGGPYWFWLTVATLLGATVGWLVHGGFGGDFVWWVLPLFWVLAVGFTGGGANVLEAAVLLAILLPVAIIFGTAAPLVARIGPSAVPGLYVALAVSKLFFGLAKDGLLGNRRFM